MRAPHRQGGVKLLCGLLALAGLGAAAQTEAAGPPADPALIAQGHAAFQYHCEACHGREHVASNGGMLPATASLAIKYHGSVPAALEDRTDLTPAYVTYIVRHGTALMPFFRRTMVSNAELRAIAAYLSRPRDAR